MLLTAMAAGSEEAFTALYRRHQASVFRFAWHMSGDEAVAEETTQETFLALIRSPQRFDPRRGPLEAWLLGIARRQVLGHLRRESGYVELQLDVSGQDCDLLENLGREQRIAAVRHGLLELAPHYREVIVLCDLEEQDYETASQALGCPVGTVRSRLHRGRALLAGILRKRNIK